MSVYVDDMLVCWRSPNWPYSESCHLVADTVEELHYFAGRLRLKPAWFQNKPELPHYDLTKGMRRWAVLHGAIEVNHLKIRELMKMYRSKCAGKERDKMKTHVHVYKVISKAEVDSDKFDLVKDAEENALKLAVSGEIEFGIADCRFIVLGFDVSE